jgi:DNA topoisomerase III
MKRFADSLVRQKGIKPPPGYKTSISICRKFLSEHAPKKSDGKKRSKRNRKTSNRPVESAAPQAAPQKRSRRQKADTDVASMARVLANSIRTPLRIPYGNKEVALKLGARYGSEGWYAPPGVDLSAFGDRGWLL